MKNWFAIAVIALFSGCSLIERISDSIASKDMINDVTIGTGIDSKKNELTGQDSAFSVPKLPAKLHWRVESAKDMSGAALVVARYTGGKAFCLDTTITLSITAEGTHVMTGTIPTWYKGKYRLIAYLKSDWKNPIDSCDFTVK